MDSHVFPNLFHLSSPFFFFCLECFKANQSQVNKYSLNICQNLGTVLSSEDIFSALKGLKF